MQVSSCEKMDTSRSIVYGSLFSFLIVFGSSFNYAIKHPSNSTLNQTNIQVTTLCNVSHYFHNNTDNYWIIATNILIPVLPAFLESMWLVRSTDDPGNQLWKLLLQKQDFFTSHALGQSSGFALTEFGSFFFQQTNAQFWNQCSSDMCDLQNEYVKLPVLCSSSKQSFEKLFEELHGNPDLIILLFGASSCLFFYYLFLCAIKRAIKLLVGFLFLVVVVLILVRQQQTLLTSWSSIFQSFISGLLIQVCISLFLKSKLNLKETNAQSNQLMEDGIPLGETSLPKSVQRSTKFSPDSRLFPVSA